MSSLPFLRIAGFALLGLPVFAVPLEFPNPGLAFEPSTRHGQPALPRQWILESGDQGHARLWRSEAGAGLALAGGAAVKGTCRIPALKEGAKPEDWWAWIEVSVPGTTDGAGWLKAEVAGPDGVVLGRQALQVGRPVRVTPESLRHFSSHTGAHAGNPLRLAEDGDPSTFWHSPYDGHSPSHPHTLEWDFGEAVPVHGFRYLPRQDGGTNGTVTESCVEVSEDGTAWRTLQTMNWDYAGNPKAGQEVRWPQPVRTRHLRWVTKRALGDGAWASAAECTVLADLPPARPMTPAPPPLRLWVKIPPESIGSLAGREAVVRLVHAEGRPVVVSALRGYLLARAPTESLLGKANGNNGPDKIGAGGLGFDALTEHGQAVCTVMRVHPGTPAASAGLAQGDLVVAVDGVPLAPADLWAGWDWFHHSPEARLGRAVLAAAAKPGKLVRLGVIRARDGEAAELALDLGQGPFMSEGFPFDVDATPRLYRDLVKWVVDNQQEDGSWKGSQIHTALGGLALLGTRDPSHRLRLRKAVDWCLAKSPDPTKEKGLCYWWMGHQGAFLAEYHLATGDESVLPWIRSAMQWIPTGSHRTKWGYLGLGHGPEGLPYEEKGLVGPAVHLAAFDALGRLCGGTSTFWETMWPYLLDTWSDIESGGHGALGYNASYRDLDEYWFRSGLFSAALNILGERPDMQAAMTRVMRARHPWFRNSHAYGEPGAAWGFMGLARVAPQRFRETMGAYAWSFALAWQPGYGLRYSTPHMGSPYMGEDELINPAYAAVLSARHRGLWLTGARDRGWLRQEAGAEASAPRLPPLVQVVGFGDADEDAARAGRAPGLGQPVANPIRGGGYPMQLVLDTGGLAAVEGLELEFEPGGLPSALVVRAGQAGGAWGPELVRCEGKALPGRVEVPLLPAVEARRIAVDLDGPPGPGPGLRSIRLLPRMRP